MAELLPIAGAADADEAMFSARVPFSTNLPGGAGGASGASEGKSYKRYFGFIFLTTTTFVFALIITYIIQAIFSNFFPKHASIWEYLLYLGIIIGLGIGVFYLGYKFFDVL